MTFLDYLHSGEDIDAPLMIGGADMPADLVWDGASRVMPEGIKRFQEILKAEITVHDNGCIEVHCDDDQLGEDFSLAAAGYISNAEYDRLFAERHDDSIGRYSLMVVYKEYDGLIDGTWIQDSTGTLQEAINKAKATEQVNSQRIKVAVVASVLSGGPNYSLRTGLKRLG